MDHRGGPGRWSHQVGFQSLTENIDTTTAAAGWCFTSSPGLAQMERELVSERTRAGLDAALGARQWLRKCSRRGIYCGQCL